MRVRSALFALLLAGCAHGVDDASVLSALRSTGAGGAGGAVDPTSDASGGSGGSSGSNGGSRNDAAGGSGGDAPPPLQGDAAVSDGDAAQPNDADATAPGLDGTGGDDATLDGSRVDADGAALDVLTRDVAPEASCVRESNVEFCIRLGKNCGTVSANDRCGVATSADCGTCIPPQVCGGAGVANFCGAPVSLAHGGTVTSSNPGVVPEDMAKAFDEDPRTKWFAGNGIRTGWIAYEFAGSMPHTVLSYGVTSANDVPGRDPTNWELQGSNDGTTWTAVDARTGQTFAARLQTNTYTCMRTAPYRRYRFMVLANGGAADLQIADLTLFGY